MTVYFGYNPGIDGEHGVSAVSVKRAGLPRCRAAATVQTADAALAWLVERIADADVCGGLAVSAPTEWTLGPGCERPADRYLRERYGDDMMVSPEFTEGAVALSGMCVLMKLRERWSDLLVTETEPRLLCGEMDRQQYDVDGFYEEMEKWLRPCTPRRSIPVVRPPLLSEPMWRAVFSAWALGRSTDHWLDLHGVAAARSERFVMRPAGRTKFLWPPPCPNTAAGGRDRLRSS